MHSPGHNGRVATELKLFDFDGVLCDSLALSLAIVNHLSGPYNFRRVDHADDLRDLSSRELVRWLGLPWWKLPFVLRAARTQMVARHEELRLFPGALETLRTLRARGQHVGIVTSNAEAVVGALIREPLDQLACGTSLFGKARSLRRLARGYERVVYFGDETRDLEAAREAGVIAAAVTWGYAREERLLTQKPDFVCRTWADVLTV